MPIRGSITELVRTGKLHCLESLMTGDQTVRTLFVTQEIQDAIRLPHPKNEAVALAEFRETLDAFLEGGALSVGLDPFQKDAHAQIARVHPVSEELWDFRIVAPKDQIRAFGAFSEHDTFVCLTWNYRGAIGNDFDSEVERARQAWRTLFGEAPPFKGKSVDDYLSNAYVV